MHLDVKRAAKAVGYHYDYARALLAKTHIKAAIAERSRKAAENTGVTPERVVAEISRVALADIGEAFDDDGNLLPIRQMPEELRRAISGIEVTEKSHKRAGGVVKRVRFWPKDRALEQLGKHFKLFTEVHEIRGAEDLERRLIAARLRLEGEKA